MDANPDVGACLAVGRRRRARVSIDLGALKPHWDAWCRSTGVAPAQRLRQLVLDTLADHAVMEPSEAAPVLIDNSGPRLRVEVRLTTAEFGAVEKLSERAGMSVNRWIVAAVRVQISGEPQFGDRELTVLADSNHQMAALGRNLNQIARALNMAPDGSARHRLEALDALRADVDRHLERVGEFIRANLSRWSR